MNKKKFFPVMFLFATTFCFAQNEIPNSEINQPAEIETLEETTPSPIEEPSEIEAPQEMVPAPIEEITEPASAEMPEEMTPAPIEEQEVRDFQVTLLTPIGTNGMNASKITNRISLNVFAGVNGGLDGVEAGGFVNVITGNAKGLQGAGFANVVLGEFDGIQAAGFSNVNLKKSEGIQVAGFTNTSLGGIKGIQAAGFVNVARGDSEGIQASGFLNYAKNMKGIQVSFINIADTLDGLAIGFLSFARNGYHTLEASSNETFQANLSFKTGGSRYFYNIFSTGVRFNDNTVDDDFHWAFGYGVGTKFKLGKRLGINADAISYAIIPRTIDGDRDWDEQDFGAVGKLNLGLSYKVAKHFTVFGGPTLNVLVNQNQSFIDNINPREIFRATDDDVNLIVYPGFNVGIRL